MSTELQPSKLGTKEQYVSPSVDVAMCVIKLSIAGIMSMSPSFLTLKRSAMKERYGELEEFTRAD